MIQKQIKITFSFLSGGGDMICLSGPVSKADFYNNPEKVFGHI